MTNAFERQVRSLYSLGATIRPEHSAWLSPPCKSHFVTVVGGDGDFAYSIIEWLIEYVGVPAEQIVFVSHLSAYPSLSEGYFQGHFIGENADDEGRVVRQQKYENVTRLNSLGGYCINYYTDDLQYQPVRGTHLAIIALSKGINSIDRVTSPEPIPNLESDDPVFQQQYKEWEDKMKTRFLLAGAHDANARMDLMRVQGELTSLGVTTTTVVDTENWLPQQIWLKALFECYASLWKPVLLDK